MKSGPVRRGGPPAGSGREPGPGPGPVLGRPVLAPALTALAAVGAGGLVLVVGLEVAGLDAQAALAALWRGAFGSWYAFTSATMVRAVPLIVIGIGFAIAFQGGALNIGAEGQFYAGAIAATAVGLEASGSAVPAVVAVPAVLGAATLAGAAWMVVPVILKLRFGVFEAISTLLLNFVAISLTSFVVLGPLQGAGGIYPQSDQLPAAARIPLIPGTRLHWGFLLALVLAPITWLVLRKTLWGFQLRAVGQGPVAARVAGRIPQDRILAGALLWSGALAGLAGGMEVGGVSYALYQNLSPGYGFTAIAVALLARLHPWGIVATGVAFGALEAGAGAMQRDAGVPAVTVYAVEAVVIVVLLLADSLARTRAAAAPASGVAPVPAPASGPGPGPGSCPGSALALALALAPILVPARVPAPAVPLPWVLAPAPAPVRVRMEPGAETRADDGDGAAGRIPGRRGSGGDPAHAGRHR